MNKSYRQIVPGAGFRYAAGDRFHIGAEYSLVPLGKVEITGLNAASGAGKASAESKILDNRFLITFTYQMNGSN